MAFWFHGYDDLRRAIRHLCVKDWKSPDFASTNWAAEE